MGGYRWEPNLHMVNYYLLDFLPRLSVERWKKVILDFFCEPFVLLCIVQDDEVAAVPVFAHICTPSVFEDIGCTSPAFDAGGCTDSVFTTTDCSATASVQNPYPAN